MLYMMYIFPFETRAFPKYRQIRTKRNYIRQGILSKGTNGINPDFFIFLCLKSIAYAPDCFNVLRFYRITHFNLLTKLFDMHRHRRNIPD